MDLIPSVIKCPQCGAALSPPGRFARQVGCSFCGATVQLDPSAVSASHFREAFRKWNSPASHGIDDSLAIGDSHWALRQLIARGEVADVYLADRARWPSERVVLKILREASDSGLFDREWETLSQLHRSDGPTISAYASFWIPDPVVRGVVSEGPQKGRQAMAFRWACGFNHTFEEVRRIHPGGVDPKVSVWMWRRVLETLAFLHRNGIAHGAVVPSHLVVQKGEHGVRLVGYGCADRVGAPLAALSSRFEVFYPGRFRGGRTLDPAADVCMSARCIAWVLGGDPATGGVSAAVPEPFAALIARIAVEARDDDPAADAWTLREEVGRISRAVFGAPSFNPLTMPG